MSGPALLVSDLSVSFGSKRAVDGVSFTINPGEIVGYLGPNGAGKSTTLKAIVGMVKPDSGRIMVAGRDAVAGPTGVKQITGFLHESGALFQVLSPREFFEIIADLRGIPRAAALTDSEYLLNLLELEPDAREQRMTSFSKGMKQKVAIAAAMLHRPALLLLDEPLNGLDVNATSRFKHLLNDYAAKGGAVLYSSHLLDVVERVCDRVIILHGGRMLAEFPLATMAEKYPGKTLEQIFHELTGYRDEPAYQS